jgi:hypothetical protein
VSRARRRREGSPPARPGRPAGVAPKQYRRRCRRGSSCLPRRLEQTNSRVLGKLQASRAGVFSCRPPARRTPIWGCLKSPCLKSPEIRTTELGPAKSIWANHSGGGRFQRALAESADSDPLEREISAPLHLAVFGPCCSISANKSEQASERAPRRAVVVVVVVGVVVAALSFARI